MKLKKEKQRVGKKHISKTELLNEKIEELKTSYKLMTCETFKKFTDFPLSDQTQKGLKEANYKMPTDVQRSSIGPALLGRDVIGTAVTGSGKTLAFLIPVLEHLFVSKWSRADGVCAIIISPTRELATQTFKVLTTVGKYHDFSASLLVGGQNLRAETPRMDQFNILICTPGRLLQHLESNNLLNTSSLEMLILDEADRCLDLGFEKELNLILDHLTSPHQTLLFSATITGTLEELVRLNLNCPVFVGNQQNLSVPGLLQQSYVVLPLEEKISMIWSFIRNHRNQKTIVFLASCKQVKFIYEVFCKLRPGISLLAIYGSLHQQRRTATYEEFLRKRKVVLFATDIASRGLDFPTVDWVVQLDCPENVTQYIHRAGRSARNKTPGESLLVLLPSEEEEMIKDLAAQQIRPQRLQINPKYLFSPKAKIDAYLAQLPELKKTAVRAFAAYIKSVSIMNNKKIFNVMKLNLVEYAKSLGLAIMPDIPILQKLRRLQELQAKHGNSECTQILSSHFKLEASESDEEDFIVLKSGTNICDDSEVDEAELQKPAKLISKASQAKKVQKKNLQINTKISFNEDGELSEGHETELGGIDIEASKRLLLEKDKEDKERHRKIIKEKKLKLKLKAKQAANEDDDTGDDDEGEEKYSENMNEHDSDYSVEENDDHTLRSEDSEESEIEELVSKKKRKKSINNLQSERPKEPRSKKSKLTEKLPIEFAENIALQLLQNS